MGGICSPFRSCRVSDNRRRRGKVSIGFAINLIRGGALQALMMAAPLLLVGMLVGLIISIFQAATSISEQTLTFVPKLLMVFIVTVIILPFMLTNIKTFTIELINMIPGLT